VTSLNVATVQVATTALTAASTAYSDGDVLDAIMPFVMSTATGIILSAVLVDKANIVGAVDAFIFDRSVTLAAVNAADSISDADALFKLGKIEFPYPTAQGLNRSAHIDSLAIPYVANASSTIYLALVTRSAHTFFGAATDINVRLTYSKDV